MTTNSMVFSVSQVVWGLMQEKRAGNFLPKSMNRDNMYRYLVDHGSW